MIQWILPAISCASHDGTRALRIEAKIQLSRRPNIYNLIGIYDAAVTYHASFLGSVQTSGDAVYDSSGVEWYCIQDGAKNQAPGPGSVWWAPASNFNFVQSDLSTVFYLDQQILAEDGLGIIQRSVSRQQGAITPDTTVIKFIDYTQVSGKDGTGATVGSSSLAAIPGAVLSSGLLDLSGTAYRTLLNIILSDPDATYTLMLSRVTGVGYNTNRELCYIGDIDYGKATAGYEEDYHPGQTTALQKLAPVLQAESVATRLKSFTVRDLILSFTYGDFLLGSNPVCFIGGMTLIPTGNDLNLAVSPFGGNGKLQISSTPLYMRYHGSRSNTLITGIRNFLHFVSLQTILSKIAVLGNFTVQTSDLQSQMTFWADALDETTLFQIVSTNIPLSSVGLCYEYTFGIDPRCNLNVQEMAGMFGWSDTLDVVLKKLAQSLVTFVKTTYDQTNFRAENILADAYQPSGTPLPNWEAGLKAGIKPRLITGSHVEVLNTGDSDKFACPRKSGTALPMETGWRVKKLGFLGSTYADQNVDIIHNASLPVDQQWTTFQPLSGGLLDAGGGGHVVGSGYDGTWATCPGSLGPKVDTGCGYVVALTDYSHEFVISQGKGGGWWGGLEASISHGNVNFITPNDSTFGSGEIVCVWSAAGGCVYGSTTKWDRHRIDISFPYAGLNGSAMPFNQSFVPYVIGYSGFGLDLVATDGSRDVRSASYDFYEFDGTGAGHQGQQIIIPEKGVFTIVAVNVGSDPHKITLDRAISGDGTNLEFRIGGPKLNNNCMIGDYWYYYSGSNPVLIGGYARHDQLEHCNHYEGDDGSYDAISQCVEQGDEE